MFRLLTGNRRLRRVLVAHFAGVKRLLFDLLRSLRVTRAPSPRGFMLEVTRSCNLKCVMCTRNYFSDLGHAHVALPDFQRIAARFPRAESVLMLGQGEPFCSPHLFDILGEAGRRCLAVHLTTNGTLLTEQRIRALGESVQYVNVSMDSPVAEDYERIRVGAKFETVVANVKALRRLRPDIMTSILCVMMKDNLGQLPRLIALAQELDVDFVVNQHVLSFDEAGDKGHASRCEAVSARIQEAKNAARSARVALQISDAGPTLRPCLEPWVRPNVTADGTLYPCCFICRADHDSPEWYMGQEVQVPTSRYKMGNVFEQDVEEIWNGPEYRALRERILSLGGRQTLTHEQLNERRRNVRKDHPFWYCDICLYRWTAAC